MPSPETLLSYYPTYAILDDIISSTNCTTLNIFIDLKNNLQTLYMKEPIYAIVENSLKSRFTDTSVFSSVLAFLAFHKLYAIKRQNLKVRFYIFFETGKSFYHLNISKKYKISRRVDDLYGLDKEKRDLFFSVLQKNYMLLERVCNKIPDVKLIRLENFEADFIPFYLIRNNFVTYGSNVANVVYSNDHDLLQCLALNGNNFIFSKKPQNKKLVKKGEACKSYLKTDKNFPDSYLPLAMAVMGDPGDDIDGVSGIGNKRACDMLEELMKIAGGFDKLRENILSGELIFDPSLVQTPNKYLNQVLEKERESKLISNNLKLLDFELISRFFDDPSSTETIGRKKGLLETLASNTIVPLNTLKPALEKAGVYLQEELEMIYYSK